MITDLITVRFPLARGCRFIILLAALTLAAAAAALPGQGVLVHLNATDVAGFNLRHTTVSLRLSPTRDLYLVTAADGRTDQQLLTELLTDPTASNPVLNAPVALVNPSLDGQSTASVLNGSTSTTTTTTTSSGGLLGALLQPVLKLADNLLNPLLGTVLNVNINLGGSTSSGGILNSSPTYFYGAVVPQAYPQQPAVSQISAGAAAHNLATGKGAEVALIDNGVDPFNPVLTSSLDASRGYNFYDNSANWSAYADLADGPTGGSDLDGQSTASVLNGQSTASVLNGTCQQEFSADGSRLNQSTASVLNGQSTASVLNSEDSATVVSELNLILACDPEFGHGTSVAGLIHLVAPQAKILPIKAFGPGGTADAAAIYQSITYAIDQHVQVMNLSFSATAASPAVQAAIQEAMQDGIVVIAAAGNDGATTAVYPASLPGVVGAGAVDGTQAGFPRAPYSNYDPAPGIIQNADVAAPGSSLFTTYPGGGQIWATASGTSFSTPLIAGEAALLAQLQKTGAAGRKLIESNSNPAITGDAHGELGHGMVNVESALRSASPSLLFWLLW
ncbi:MAG TPA: S8 family serine peptidase [Terriglobales bacterium]|nr:S8 family serine peptidase [Terriglobales bacterium]